MYRFKLCGQSLHHVPTFVSCYLQNLITSIPFNCRSMANTPISIQSVGSTLSRRSTGEFYPDQIMSPHNWQYMQDPYANPQGSWSREMGRQPLVNRVIITSVLVFLVYSETRRHFSLLMELVLRCLNGL